MHDIRFFLFGDEAPRFVLGQAGVNLGEEFSEFAIGVELLQLRTQARALGRGGGEGDAADGKTLNVYAP